jgi:hypothetical protein
LIDPNPFMNNLQDGSTANFRFRLESVGANNIALAKRAAFTLMGRSTKLCTTESRLWTGALQLAQWGL